MNPPEFPTGETKLLEWIDRTGMLLESQVVGSGLNRPLNNLLRAGVVDIIPHPTVREGNAPASAIVRRKIPQ